MNVKQLIEDGKAVLGIEFGSTRIKAVLMDTEGAVIATGGHGWENRFENGIWTYTIEDIWSGLSDCYQSIKSQVYEKYNVNITTLASIGFSAMMHGYMAFDGEDNLLVPFRTWRNTITEEAASILTKEFNYNIPQRWSVSHLYQSVLNKEEHVNQIRYFTTLAGYVHWKLTGRKVLGVGDASGMFPIDSKTGNYNESMMSMFDGLMGKEGVNLKLEDILPEVLTAGKEAGSLTEEGAKLLDITGTLRPGIPMCPPEGDAGTGMVATNSVAIKTGNISAGTSVFAMVVLEDELSKVYPEIDMVTTPDGKPVAMVHCNNCTSEINAWVNVFAEFMRLMHHEPDMNELYEKLYSVAMKGNSDCRKLLSYNYLSGEPVTGFEQGALLFARSANASFNLPNFMRMHLYSALATLKIGMDILIKDEGVQVEEMLGHGGYFKTKNVGQQIAADAIGAPITVMETAGEGGAWGVGVLALYMISKEKDETLSQFLDNKIFKNQIGSRLFPNSDNVEGFEEFMKEYKRGLSVEKEAVRVLC